MIADAVRVGVFELGCIVKDSLSKSWRGRGHRGGGCNPNEGVSLGVDNRTVRASVHEWSCRPAQQMALADRSSVYMQMKGR